MGEIPTILVNNWPWRPVSACAICHEPANKVCNRTDCPTAAWNARVANAKREDECEPRS